MKQILLLPLLFGFAIATMAQYADTSGHVLAAQYLKKSKNQKTAGWILLFGGAGLTGIGLVVGVSSVWIDILEGDTKGSSTGGILMATGLASMAGSIPLFIASGRNRRKAAGYIGLKLEKSTLVSHGLSFSKQYPAVGFSIRL